MSGFRRGDVVLVRFVFSDESGAKLRPAVVVSSRAYHSTRQEVVVAAVTSNVERRLLGDHLLADWRAAGLLYPSRATGILRTIRRAMIERRLGSLSGRDLAAVGRELRRSLAL
jgi:mRNA interferase MazF